MLWPLAHLCYEIPGLGVEKKGIKRYQLGWLSILKSNNTKKKKKGSNCFHRLG